MTRKILLGSLVAATLAGAPAYAQSSGQLLKGGAIGAGAGAVAGALIPGMSVGTGALVGAAGGAAITALNHRHHYYKDRYGRRYYMDKRGRRIYR
jgi:hypothetical protein